MMMAEAALDQKLGTLLKMPRLHRLVTPGYPASDEASGATAPCMSTCRFQTPRVNLVFTILSS
jgi:hypothetical protein